MSVVVVVKKQGRAAIASDSQTTIGGELILRAEHTLYADKLLKIRNGYLGLTGWALFQNVFRMLIAEHPELFEIDDESSLLRQMFRWHDTLREHAYLLTQESNDQPVESSQISGMIAHSSGIYSFTSYRRVVTYQKYWAMGSGRDIALGALHANYDRYQRVDMIARAAVEAACEFDTHCGAPVYVRTLKCET